MQKAPYCFAAKQKLGSFDRRAEAAGSRARETLVRSRSLAHFLRPRRDARKPVYHRDFVTAACPAGCCQEQNTANGATGVVDWPAGASAE